MQVCFIDAKQEIVSNNNNTIQAMKEVVVPVTMTSVVNASMFAILNLISIPAVYLTAQAALIAVVFLYLTVIFCYPAYCFLDMGRQLKGRYDVCFCKRRNEAENLTSTEMHEQEDHGLNVIVYEKVYKPLMLSKKKRMRLVHVVVWAIAITLFGLGIWGITDREIGLGLEVSCRARVCIAWLSERTSSLLIANSLRVHSLALL